MARHGFIALLTLLAAGALWAARPTAVHTLDHEHEEIAAADGEGLRAALAAWADGCQIVEGGAIYAMQCKEPAAAGSDRNAEDERGMPAALVLFRDLDETVYLAGCPLLDEERIRRLDRERNESEEEEPLDPELEADVRDCREVETGRTFSAEVDGDELRIVISGRQLRMALYQTQPKPRTTSTPYNPPPTKGSLGHAGPPTSATFEINPADEPNWAPPEEPNALSRPRPVAPSLRAPSVARTSLRAGRIRVTCGSGDAQIWIGGSFLGQAPIDAPLPAGRHVIVAKQERSELSTKLELEAGQSLQVDACSGEFVPARR